MTPIALWTGRLPKLRLLPADGWILAVALLSALGGAASLGYLHLNGTALACSANIALCGLLLDHRWPLSPPSGLQPKDAPKGPDERLVTIEIRHGKLLMGWDVGVLWFERGGFGFVGETVSFVVPRALVHLEDSANLLGFDTPNLSLQFGDTHLRIVPIGAELNAQMTVARIESLPEVATPETVLPPVGLHPDLITRAVAVRRRLPLLWSLLAFASFASFPGQIKNLFSPGLLDIVLTFANTAAFLLIASFGGLLPKEIRAALPERYRRKGD